MIQQNYDSILNKIIAATNLPKEEIENKVNEKLKELQDLVSREGAAHIVANELNVKLFDSIPKDLKIKSIMPGLSSLNVLGKVTAMYEPRTYKTNTREGRVASLMLSDETGTIRVTIWDEKLIDELKNIKQGNILKIKNAYSKLNNNFKELHLGNKAQIIINPEGEHIDEVKITPTTQRKELKDIQEGDYIEITGTIVQIFEPRYYQACPMCNKKVELQNTSYICKEHKQVSPKQVPIVNIYFDDGTSNIRAVAFREQAEKLIGGDFNNLEELKKRTLGSQLILRGRVTKNTMFDRLEFTINNIEEANPEELIAELEAK